VLVAAAACSPAASTQQADLPTLAALPTLTATTASPTEPVTRTPVKIVASEPPTEIVPATATPTVTPSTTITDTPTPTATDTPLPTDTEIPTADNEGLVALAQLALNATVLPPATLIPTAAQAALTATLPPGVIQIPPAPTTCTYPPPGGFATVFLSNPGLVAQIGCPVGVPPVAANIPSAAQVFEHGEMMWLQGPPPVIYALFSSGRWQRYDDTFNANTDPFSGGETAPPGLKEPVRGFGKVWRNSPEVRGGLGWATGDEAGGQAVVQLFDRGEMIYLPERGMIYTLVFDAGGLSGSWQAVPGSF
jgi:hypothetical protein